MANSPRKKRNPKDKRGPHQALPIKDDELFAVAALLRDMSHRIHQLASSVATSEPRIAQLKSWKTFAEAVAVAMKISGKFAADFEAQTVANVTGFRALAAWVECVVYSASGQVWSARNKNTPPRSPWALGWERGNRRSGFIATCQT